MCNEQFLIAKNKALEDAIKKFKISKRGSFKILKLIKINLNELIDNGLNMKEQIEIINSALNIKIAYTTYKSFYYAHVSNATKRKNNQNIEVKKEPNKSANIDIFADLK
jgi:hypothetical protein